MKKKVLITRKLLRSNEEKASKLWDVKLNLNDEIYSAKKVIEPNVKFLNKPQYHQNFDGASTPCF